jgi:hypothetical protein
VHPRAAAGGDEGRARLHRPPRFKDDTRKLFEAAGFDWKGEFVIPKNPQAIAQRQKLHSLLFITGAVTRGSSPRRSTITS